VKLVAFARIAKLVALLGFVLPWVLVSCSGQTVLTASGLDLAVGSLTFHNPVNGVVQHQQVSADIWLIIAIVFIGLGLLVSFLPDTNNRNIGGNLIGSSALAAILSFLGIQAAHDTHHWQQQQQAADATAQQIDQAVLAAIQVQDQSGFYITMLSLVVAGGIGFVLFNDLQDSVSGAVRSLGDPPNPALNDPVDPVKSRPPPPVVTSHVSHADENIDQDTAFWDGVSDKNNVDHLEEYLIRFPHGRFAQLARNRLERKGVAAPAPIEMPASPLPLATEAHTPLQPAQTWCAGCGVVLEPDSKFCADCGEPVPA
jgi:hypothetical protein